LFIAVFGCVSEQIGRTHFLTPDIPADSISRFGVSGILRARFHRHELGVIICLGGSCGRILLECPGYSSFFSRSYAGFVSYAHRDPCLHPEEPRRLSLDLLDGNAVRKPTVA
jgi:hypothetical protein